MDDGVNSPSSLHITFGTLEPSTFVRPEASKASSAQSNTESDLSESLKVIMRNKEK